MDLTPPASWETIRRRQALGGRRPAGQLPVERGYSSVGDRPEKALRHAIERGRLRFAYEPILRLSDGVLAGFEALLHCPDPVLGRMTPLELQQIAQAAGLTGPLTTWMIAESCWRLSSWLALRGEHKQGFKVYLNLVGSSLAAPKLVPRLQAALAINQLPAEHLVIEVTPGACSERSGTREVLHQIRELGVQVALTEAGSNAFGNLRKLPLDVVKIDRNLVSRLRGGDGPEMLGAILGRAHQLDIEVIAEGVETGTQFIQLRRLGCDLAQGFLLPNPCGPEAARDLIRGEICWPFERQSGEFSGGMV